MILATQKAEIMRMVVLDQARQTVSKTPSKLIKGWARWHIPVTSL
jgi:hypothetical protein